MNSEYLFPQRLNRRDFLKMGAASAAALALPSLSQAQDGPVKIGEGKWTYTLEESWGKLPEGMTFGFGCGIVVDSKDRVYVTSRSTNPCVAIFGADGKLEETWSKDFGNGYNPDEVKATAHCVYWSKEADGEFLYFTENVGGPNKSLGKRVYKTNLKGEVFYTIGNVETEDATHQKFTWTNPTDVAVAPNGDIYVVDGYGSQIVSRFDKNFKHLKTIGGRAQKNADGTEPAKGKDAPHGTFNTCHGVWVNTLKSTPEVYIADRANSRYEIFDLELNYKRTVAGDFVRNPCCFYQAQGQSLRPRSRQPRGDHRQGRPMCRPARRRQGREEGRVSDRAEGQIHHAARAHRRQQGQPLRPRMGALRPRAQVRAHARLIATRPAVGRGFFPVRWPAASACPALEIPSSPRRARIHPAPMPRVLIAGCGFVGLATARLLHGEGWSVLGCTHSAEIRRRVEQ